MNRCSRLGFHSASLQCMMEELDVEKYPWSKYNIDFGFDIGFGSNWDTKDCGKAESP